MLAMHLKCDGPHQEGYNKHSGSARSHSLIGRRIFHLIISVLVVYGVFFAVVVVINEVRINRAVNEVYSFLGHPDLEKLSDLSAESGELLKIVKEHFLIRPATRETPYELARPGKREFAQDRELAALISTHFEGKKNGFFFEAGAYDGELLSNTLSYERELNWTGILVEPNPLAIQGILRKKRKAWVLKGCVHSGNKPIKLSLLPSGWCGGVSTSNSKRAVLNAFYPVKSIQVWCFPIQTVLSAVGVNQIDYMILDTEGGELEVMKSVDWNRNTIRLLQVEYHVFDGKMFNLQESLAKRKRILDYMNQYHSTSYNLLIDFIGSWSRDFVFVLS